MNTLSRQRVWDLPVRLFHWSLVILVALLWATGEFGGFDLTFSLPGKGSVYLSNMDVHELLGQGVLTLVVFRILWGVWGSATARFAGFVRGPAQVLGEIRSLMHGQVPETHGHNPLGALMVVAVLATLLFQGVTGLFSADDLFFEGPLANLVSDDTSEFLTGLHHQSFSLLQILIVLHIGAVLYYLVRGRNLIAPMVTGKKAATDDNPEITFAPLWRAVISFGIALGAVYFLVNL